jgi:hypothetical protein
MTWHSIFDLSTTQERHLVASYAVILLVQGGYFAWTAWQWRQSKKPRLNNHR